jgi:mono/diheme cytochrome c family protein
MQREQEGGNMKLLLSSLAALMLLSGGIAANREWGQYLTEEVAQCQQCHGMRLDGIAKHAPNQAPNITGGGELWKQWGPGGMRIFLQTGRNPEGNVAASPMPGYRLRGDDAEAITAYLQSLK